MDNCTGTIGECIVSHYILEFGSQTYNEILIFCPTSIDDKYVYSKNWCSLNTPIFKNKKVGWFKPFFYYINLLEKKSSE